MFSHPVMFCAHLFVGPWTAACQASLFLTISQSLPKIMSIALVMPSSHFILWQALLLLPSIFPGNRDFSNELAACIRWPKYWGFNFSISPSNEYLGLISLKIDSFDLLAQDFQEFSPATSLKESVLQCSAFMVQLSQQYVTAGKSIALTMWAFVGRVVSAFQHTV